MQDSSHILQQQVTQACESGTPLLIRGGGSKSFYGRQGEGERLATGIHNGIIDYSPTELVLTARAGTPLVEIEQTLAGHGQMLACEPPHFGAATFGGMLACGLSGPSRPYRSSVADIVLGCRIINGRGEVLQFGGKVMKNVAGYDVSRLMVGALGCLGLVLDATVKVVPRPAADTSYAFSVAENQVVPFINNLRKRGLPVSASAYLGGELHVRFSAGEKEVAALGEELQKHFGFIEHRSHTDVSFWHDLAEQHLPFFDHAENLWRLSLPADAVTADLDGETCTEWGGALRWLKTPMPGDELFSRMRALNGHATLFRSSQAMTENVFQPLSTPMLQWHRNLKRAFDPKGVFNQGRMYAEF